LGCFCRNPAAAAITTTTAHANTNTTNGAITKKHTVYSSL